MAHIPYSKVLKGTSGVGARCWGTPVEEEEEEEEGGGGGGGGEAFLHLETRERVQTRREFNRKILRGKPTRCRVIPGRPALLDWRGRPRPSRTAPLGMTKTPTLRVSADMLVSESKQRPPPRSPPGGYKVVVEEEEERSLIVDLKSHTQLAA
jgi:hypothetical protein